MTSEPEIRRVDDIGQLMSWRIEVIRAVFGREPDDALIADNYTYYRTHIAAGRHIAVVATVDGVDAGCGSVCLSEELPSPENPGGRCAYLMNIYVRRSYRKRGVGRAIVMWLVAEAEQLGCGKVYLETTDAGRRLYEGCGFKEMDGMMKFYA